MRYQSHKSINLLYQYKYTGTYQADLFLQGKMPRHTLKPAEVAATLPLIRTGRNGRDWEFQAEDGALQFYTIRPEDNDWAWNYELFMGDACFDAGKEPKLTISRR